MYKLYMVILELVWSAFLAKVFLNTFSVSKVSLFTWSISCDTLRINSWAMTLYIMISCVFYSSFQFKSNDLIVRKLYMGILELVRILGQSFFKHFLGIQGVTSHMKYILWHTSHKFMSNDTLYHNFIWILFIILV